MGLNWKTFGFIVAAVAVGVAAGKMVAEPGIMYLRGMAMGSQAAPATQPAEQKAAA